MDAKHTPGPWTYQPASNYVGYSISPRGTLPTLAAVERPVGGELLTIEAFNFPGETEANARLIAAAPELLEALQVAELILRERGLRAHGGYKQIESAIAKATGAPANDQ